MTDDKNNIQEEKEMIAHAEAITRSFGGRRENILPILNAIHREHNYLPRAVLEYLAENSGIAPAVVAGVSTFYTGFRHTPAGRHFIKVCIGTACHVKGANALYDDFKKNLSIPDNEDTDRDRLFTVTKVACLGCCMLAPAVQIDDITYGPVKSEDIHAVLADFLRSGKTEAAETGATASGSAFGSVRVCTCSSCSAAGASDVYTEIMNKLAAENLSVRLKTVGCTGVSFNAPLVEIEDAAGETFRYGLVKPADVVRIIHNHFRPKKILPAVRRKIYSLLEDLSAEGAPPEVTRYLPDTRDTCLGGSYTGMQKRIATDLGGCLDPLDIDEYAASGGFESLNSCGVSINPGGVISIVRESGLRGRGGAGFSTAAKWEAVRDRPETNKYIICNGDEGDPGAFMDRMILESFPFRVIEGMAVAAFACGIRKGYVYLRSEYPLAAGRMRKAIGLCRERGVIGDSAFGGAGFDLDIFVSAGAFVCGEESALIASIEGRRGTPSFRPPFPSEKGLFGCPTLVNNVETFAMVPWIIKNGPGEFAGMGTPGSSGTKTFALAGKVRDGGLIEVEMGTTVSDIVYGIGGGIPGGRKLKAVQIGGPSGGCIPASMTDTPVDYEQLGKKGAIMGSGGMIVLDDEDCMVDVAKYFMSFTQDESCGKCTFCRVGTKRMLEILENLTEGKGSEKELERLGELARSTIRGSLCGLGRSAPNPVLTSLKYFRDEFTAHLEGRCPAGKCKPLIMYSINDKCIGCTRCAQRCPQDAIEPRPYSRHHIDPGLCSKCDICRQCCPADAVEITAAQPPGERE